MIRRNFIKTTGLVTAGVGLAGNLAYSNASTAVTNKLPLSLCHMTLRKVVYIFVL